MNYPYLRSVLCKSCYVEENIRQILHLYIQNSTVWTQPYYRFNLYRFYTASSSYIRCHIPPFKLSQQVFVMKSSITHGRE